MSILNYLNDRKTSNGFCLLALIDPDKKNDLKIDTILSKINSSPFDAILIGGSSIEDDLLEERIAYIKSKTTLPLISFPGSSNQISEQIDSMLYLNLISGRNPKYLIDEQVKGAKKIKKIGIETIPTAYILLDGGSTTSVSNISETSALSMDDKSNILSHALAGQFMGNRLIYFDCGSGSSNSITCELLDYIYQNINIPIIVGGGIKSYKEAYNFYKNGASFVVVGNALENDEYIP
jgi:putative glycerol-1-phosphate prenyltransferase